MENNILEAKKRAEGPQNPQKIIEKLVKDVSQDHQKSSLGWHYAQATFLSLTKIDFTDETRVHICRNRKLVFFEEMEQEFLKKTQKK